jgi:DNA helicase HerA-like ATPase
MSKGLFLGKEAEAAGDALGPRIDLNPTDLLTHGLIVGMTGSGKTGLAIALIEEVMGQGVPVIAIDPKGDLGNLLLLFDDLSPKSFEPWIDGDAARREGKTPAEAAQRAAEVWTKGLAEWGLGLADIKELKAKRDAVIYTPGSSSGVQLNVLQSLEAPSLAFEKAPEDLRDEIAGIVSGLLGLLKIEADPLQSQEYILLATIIESAWKSGKNLTLETLIAAVADPPFDKIGALPLESVYPRKQRQGLMMALNNLLASPQFEAWRVGQPLDIQSRCSTPRTVGPRLSVIYTAHLSEEERFFVTALVLDKVKTWMRRQSGTTSLRALVYMDEIYGYFPPHPANPPTKRPLLTLLKQARAQGVGIVLATQNPIDLDYKGLGNIGTWLVGRLQTDNDRARLRDGLVGAGVDARGGGDVMLGADPQAGVPAPRRPPSASPASSPRASRCRTCAAPSRARRYPSSWPSTRATATVGFADRVRSARRRCLRRPVLPRALQAPLLLEAMVRLAGRGSPPRQVRLSAQGSGRDHRRRASILSRSPHPAEILDAEHHRPRERRLEGLAPPRPIRVRYGDLPVVPGGGGRSKGTREAPSRTAWPTSLQDDRCLLDARPRSMQSEARESRVDEFERAPCRGRRVGAPRPEASRRSFRQAER